MYYTREKRRRRRMLRRMVWRTVICLTGILILVGGLKLTFLALQHLSSGQEAFLETDEDLEIKAPGADTDEEDSEQVPASVSLKTKDDILLVNKSNPLSETYRPTLEKMHDYGVEVDASIYDALNNMLRAGEKEGLSFWVASGYRSLERQRELLDEDIEALIRQGYSYSEAYEEVVKETMPVGCSEHATGLAVDIVAKDYQILDYKQANTDEIKWLQKNCSQYGFILRYPDGKEDITGVSYESWHFRYVGVNAAKEIMSQGITLEEYLGE